MQNQKISFHATTAIPRYGCVTSLGELADSSNPLHENKIIGVTEGEVANTAWGDATLVGLLFNKDWTWTSGARIYLNGTVLSETAPGVGFVQQMGWALTPQSVQINVQSSGTGGPGPTGPVGPAGPIGATGATGATGPAGAGIVAGIIAMWSGLLVNIPSGWALCDGTGGTPDLRDKFVRGAPAAVDPGGTGGSNSYTPAGTVSQPTFTGNALAGHAHELPFAIDSTESPPDIDVVPQAVFGTGTSRSTTYHANGNASAETNPVALTESVSAGTPAGTVSQPTFSGTPATIMPEYYAIAFIMKL